MSRLELSLNTWGDVNSKNSSLWVELDHRSVSDLRKLIDVSDELVVAFLTHTNWDKLPNTITELYYSRMRIIVEDYFAPNAAKIICDRIPYITTDLGDHIPHPQPRNLRPLMGVVPDICIVRSDTTPVSVIYDKTLKQSYVRILINSIGDLVKYYTELQSYKDSMILVCGNTYEYITSTHK